MQKPAFSADEVRAIMDAFGDTHEAFAARVGISTTAVARYLKRGTMGATLDVVQRLSELEQAQDRAKKEARRPKR